MKKAIVLFLLLVFMVVLAQPIWAAEINAGGELKSILNYNLQDDQMINASTLYKLKLETDLGFDGKMFLSFDGNYSLLQQTGSFELDEAYVSVYLPTTDLTIGRQVINWGTADGINPTNYINPVDSSGLFTGDEMKQKPVLSTMATYYGDNFSLTGVTVFDFVPANIDLDMLLEAGYQGFDLSNVSEPASNLENMEFALKLETRAGGYDLKFSYFHGFEDFPAIKLLYDPQTGFPAGEEIYYRRVNKIGFATAGVIEPVGVWAEAAYVIPEEIQLSPLEVMLSPNEPYIQAIVGSDYTFKGGLYVEGQYIYYGNGSFIMPYNVSGEIEPGHYLLGRLSYEINENNRVELTGITNLKEKCSILMPSLTYSLTQVTDLVISPVFTAGEGEFDFLPSMLNISVRTSF